MEGRCIKIKIGLYADPHFSQNSSMLVGRDGKYSKRLTNLIESFSWMNDFFSREGCSEVFCLGDMTDRPDLTAEEITAMSECSISDHHLIVGNHCRSDKNGEINSLSIFSSIYYEPEVISLGSRNILILPYNSTPVDLSDYKDIDVIFSHNDLKGYDFGNHISGEGYSLEDILKSCKLFINGHLHNGGWLVQDRILNLGQLSGMNFSSCGGQWEPSVAILDTENLSIKFYENPVALRFKKIEMKTLVSLKNYLNSLDSNSGKYVIQVRVPDSISQSARKLLDQYDNVVASRVLAIKSSKKTTTKSVSEEVPSKTNIYDKLRSFIKLQNSSKFDVDKVNEIINNLEKKEGVE